MPLPAFIASAGPALAGLAKGGFGKAALAGLGSSFGVNVGERLFGEDDEMSQLLGLTGGVPQLPTGGTLGSFSSQIFNQPAAIGRRFN